MLVWIHGGSNRAGAGGGTVESRITDRGIVLVSVQYRLGALGFLSHPALQAAPRLTLWSSLKCAGLKLWDEETRRMVGFAHARR